MTNTPLSGEELKAAVERLEKRAATWRLNDDSAWLKVKLGDLRLVLSALSTRPAPSGDGLVEALTPFANWAADNTEADPLNPAFGMWGGNRCESERINVWFGPTDFYRARQAVAAHQPTVRIPQPTDDQRAYLEKAVRREPVDMSTVIGGPRKPTLAVKEP